MKTIILLISIFSISKVYCGDNLWVQKVGKNVVFGFNEYKGEYFFDDDILETFCDKSKDYLGSFLRDLKKYKCEEITNYNSTICSVLKKELTKHMDSEFPFGLEVNPYLKFSFMPNEMDISQLKKKISSEHNIKEDNVIFAGHLEEIESRDIKIKQRQKGFFTDLLNLTNLDSFVEAEDYIGQGYANNRYTACSIIEKENIIIAKKKKSSIVIFEVVEDQKISSLWNIYKKLRRFWNSSQMRVKQNDLERLLFLGAEMKRLNKFSPILDDELNQISRWYDDFFSVEIKKSEVRITPKRYSSIDAFKDKLFPPKKHLVEFDIKLTQGED